MSEISWCSNCRREVPPNSHCCPYCGVFFHKKIDASHDDYLRDQRELHRRQWSLFKDKAKDWGLGLVIVLSVILVVGGVSSGLYFMVTSGHFFGIIAAIFLIGAFVAQGFMK